jgi:hypothetical protein
VLRLGLRAAAAQQATQLPCSGGHDARPASGGGSRVVSGCACVQQEQAAAACTPPPPAALVALHARAEHLCGALRLVALGLAGLQPLLPPLLRAAAAAGCGLEPCGWLPPQVRGCPALLAAVRAASCCSGRQGTAAGAYRRRRSINAAGALQGCGWGARSARPARPAGAGPG